MAINFDNISNFFQGSSLGKLAGNFSKTASEFGKVLYRDGSNVMTGPLDMNSRRILNVPDPIDDNDVVNLKSVKLIADDIAKGPTGPANSTYSSLAALKAAQITNGSYIFAPPNGSEGVIPAATFYFRSGNFSSRPDGPGFVKLTGVTTGALFAARDTAIVPNIDTTKDAYDAIQAVIDQAVPGDVIRLPRATYTLTKGPIVKPGIALDLNGSTLTLTLSGALDRGVRLRSFAQVFGGTIAVVSSGQPSLQAGVHSPVTVGPLYGDSPTVGGISPDEDVTGWRIYDLTLSTDKLVSENGAYAVGGVAIQIYGDASHGVIEDIRIPDSNRMFGGIHLDWAPVGPIDSGNILGSRTAFDAGNAFTTHPNNITIRKIRGGRLSRPVGGIDGGSHGIRLSGVHNILVEDVHFDATTYCTAFHTAGDVGFEFSRDDDRRQAHQNIVIRDVSCPDTGPSGPVVWSDTLADNVYRAALQQGYQALLPMPMLTNMVVERAVGRASGTVTENSIGIRVIHQRGGIFRDCSSTGHMIGHMTGDLAVDVIFERPRWSLTRMEGVFVGEGSQTPPVRCKIIDPIGSLANRAGLGRASVFVTRSVDTVVSGGAIGAAVDETAKFGIQIDSFVNGCSNATIRGNPTILGHAAGGAAISVSSDEGWGALRAFEGGATYGPGVTTQWAGLSIVPVSVEFGKRRSRASAAKLSGYSTPPASYPAIAGEVIDYTDPAITGDTPPLYLSGSVCYASGSPGTWRFKS